MAQWIGQFSGRTHATRVEDMEASLRNAIASFHASHEDDRGRKIKAIRRLAERVLAARLKLLKARIEDLQPPRSSPVADGSGVESLKKREAQAREEGVTGVLKEFGLESLAGGGDEH